MSSAQNVQMQIRHALSAVAADIRHNAKTVRVVSFANRGADIEFILAHLSPSTPFVALLRPVFLDVIARHLILIRFSSQFEIFAKFGKSASLYTLMRPF